MLRGPQTNGVATNTVLSVPGAIRPPGVLPGAPITLAGPISSGGLPPPPPIQGSRIVVLQVRPGGGGALSGHRGMIIVGWARVA